VSLTTIVNHLRDSLHLKYLHLRWILHQLTEQLRAIRGQKCEELLPLLESMVTNKFVTIVASDESWFTLEYQHSLKWSVHRQEAPEGARQQIGTKQFTLTVIWGMGGFHVVDLMTSQRSFDSQYFVSNVMTPLIANIVPQRRIRQARGLHLHLDGYRVHFFQRSENNSSLKIRFCVWRTHPTVPILHHQTSGFSAM
jgi:hypothetical protein